MSETKAPTEGTVVIRTPGGPEIKWRTLRMIGLGADPELAATIAASDADVHDIERLLKTGCPLELAWQITQPLAEPAKLAGPEEDVERTR